MKKLIVFLLFAVGAQAQNVWWTGQATATATNVGGQSAVPINGLPGAYVAFFNMAGAPASSYASQTSAIPCPLNAPVVWQGTSSCVGTADSQGNFGAWFQPGQYQFVYSYNGQSHVGYFTAG